MALLKLFLAMLAIALAAANYSAYSNGGESGGGDVITDPGNGGSDGGVVDRPPTTTPPPPVTPPPPTLARLSWMAPLARENGDPLRVGEITGYRIRIERKGSSTIQVRSVGANTTSLTIELTNPGTYYFSIAAVDTSGVYSDYSGKVSRTVN